MIAVLLIFIFLFFGWVGLAVISAVFGGVDANFVYSTVFGMTAMNIAGIYVIVSKLKEIEKKIDAMKDKKEEKKDNNAEKIEGEDKENKDS